MAKALRVFVVVLFVLSIAGLVLGILLFNQRTLVKERTQTLEEGVATIAQEIVKPREPHIRAMEQRVDREALMSPDKTARDGQIELVKRLVQARHDQYFQEGEDHVATKGKLAQTEAELFTTRQQLADTRNQLAAERERVQALTAEVAAKKAEIDQLKGEVATLNDTVAGLRADLAKKDEEVQNLIVEVKQLEAEVSRYRGADGSVIGKVKPGLTGEIVAVNPEWNFVVLNIGSEASLVPTAEMLVHRGEELIGRVRVMSVTEKLAIADIMRGEWEMGVPLREGDRVLF